MGNLVSHCIGTPRPCPGCTATPFGRKHTALDGPPDFGLSPLFEARTLLGSGTCAETWKCMDYSTNQTVAIKMLKRPVISQLRAMLEHEVKIHASLGQGHVNLISCTGVTLTPTHLGIVMECASNSTLTTVVKVRLAAASNSGDSEALVMKEIEARYWFVQLVSAVEYLHAHQIAHRDIKLDNICLDSQKPPRLKLIDFGFAKRWEGDSNMTTKLGTPVYMSPQLISTHFREVSKLTYDAAKADLYACGVVLFALLMGCFPFDHGCLDPENSQTFEELRDCHQSCNWRETPNGQRAVTLLSTECLDLLNKMLERDEQHRVSIQHIRQHPWLAMPLLPEHQQALDTMAQEQACMHAPEPLRNGQQSLANEDELRRLLDQAFSAELPHPGQPPELLRLHGAAGAPARGKLKLGVVTEEGESRRRNSSFGSSTSTSRSAPLEIAASGARNKASGAAAEKAAVGASGNADRGAGAGPQAAL